MPSLWSTATVGLVAATTAAGVYATQSPDLHVPLETPKATVYLPVVKQADTAVPAAPKLVADVREPRNDQWVSEALKQARIVGDAAGKPPVSEPLQLAEASGEPAAAPVEVRRNTPAPVEKKVASAAPAPRKQAEKKPEPVKKARPLPKSNLAKLRQAAKAPGDADNAFMLSRELRSSGADSTEWVAMLEWAADHSHQPSIYKLGTVFRDGDGVQKDTRFARFWFEMGAAEGHLPSIHNLGLMLVQGQGGPKEPERGYRLIGLAADNGFTDSMKLIAELPASN
jgi:hypothetical protein